MEFIDLAAQHQRIERRLSERMERVFKHSRYVMGPEVGELERQLADYVGVRHCVSISNGTTALLMALLALGIGEGDEVITTPFSFIAPAEMVAILRAKPVFVDIDPETYNLDPAKIEAAITSKTKAIVAVDLFGQCADYDAINAIAQKHGLAVIEDAAQSFGATYKGRQAGSLARIATTSFFPSKPLGCYGEGGACFTDDDAIAKTMRCIVNHGQDRRYHHVLLGFNGRLDTLQAAVLLTKLEIFPEELELRREVAKRYDQLLRGVVKTPVIASYNTSVYAQYTIESAARDVLSECLAEEGIPTAVHYPEALHKQPSFAGQNLACGELLMSEQASDRVLSLPFHPYLKEETQHHIAQAIASVVSLQSVA